MTRRERIEAALQSVVNVASETWTGPESAEITRLVEFNEAALRFDATREHVTITLQFVDGKREAIRIYSTHRGEHE